MTNQRDVIVETIRQVLAGGPPVRLAVVFGSAARAALRPDSDVDIGIGIVPSDSELPLAAELDLQARLERACARPVDLVRLDRASTLLGWEAARCAVPVVANPPQEFPRFLAEAAIEHAEFMETYAPTAERYRQRLLEKVAELPSTRRSPTNWPEPSPSAIAWRMATRRWISTGCGRSCRSASARSTATPQMAYVVARPRRSARPASMPVCLPWSTTTLPLTTT